MFPYQIFKGIIRYWPQTNSAKEILFVNEIEEVSILNYINQWLKKRIDREINSKNCIEPFQ